MSRAVKLSGRAAGTLQSVARSTKKSGSSASSAAMPGPNPASSSNSRPAASAASTSKRKNSSSNPSTPKRAKGATEGSSSSATPTRASAKSPKAPKAPKVPKETPEKRLARYRMTPPAATMERIERAFQHRLYLIDKKPSGDPPTSCSFHVLGSTGNVYEVELQQKPHCSCPDFPRSGLCKHILFVLLRVLKLDRNDPRVWQKALLTTEVRELLEISGVSGTVLASQNVRDRFRQIQGPGKSEDGDAASKQREIVGDCPICYEQMDDGKGKAKEAVVFCRSCGNNVHKDCFDKWKQSKSSGTTCIYCRAVWDEPQKPGGSEYINLAEASEPHRNQPSSLAELYPDSHEWIGFRKRRGSGRGRGRRR